MRVDTLVEQGVEHTIAIVNGPIPLRLLVPGANEEAKVQAVIGDFLCNL